MVHGNAHPRIGSTMFMQGQRSAMFLWQCSSKVVAMFLRLDAFAENYHHIHQYRQFVMQCIFARDNEVIKTIKRRLGISNDTPHLMLYLSMFLWTVFMRVTCKVNVVTNCGERGKLSRQFKNLAKMCSFDNPLPIFDSLSLIPLAPCCTSNNLSSATSWTCNSWWGHDGRLTFAPARDTAGGLAAEHRRLYQAPTEIRHPRWTSPRAPAGFTQPGAMPLNLPCLVTCQGQSSSTEIRKPLL